MYVCHIPRYTGFGLGAEQPTVTLASVMPPQSKAIIPSSPLTIAGRAISWTEFFAGVGIVYLVLSVWSGGKKVSQWSATRRKKKEKRRETVERARRELREAGAWF